jgi:ABC-type sugar transport system permease subunit
VTALVAPRLTRAGYLAPLVVVLGVWVYGPLVWTGALSLFDRT